MKNILTLPLLALLSTFVLPADASYYDVSVTRKSRNLYKIDGRNVLVQTRYCYAYAYSEEAILKSTGYGGELILLQSKDKCDVKAVLGAANQRPGKYVVTLNRDEDDWYEVFGTGVYVKTSSCISLALGTEAYLTIATASGFGTLQFDDGINCMVEGIYSKMQL